MESSSGEAHKQMIIEAHNNNIQQSHKTRLSQLAEQQRNRYACLASKASQLASANMRGRESRGVRVLESPSGITKWNHQVESSSGEAHNNQLKRTTNQQHSALTQNAKRASASSLNSNVTGTRAWLQKSASSRATAITEAVCKAVDGPTL